MSIAGGFEQAIIRGESIGCTALQIFTKSNRQWKAKPIQPQEAELFKQTVRDSSITAKAIVAHASYLINIGATDPAIRQKSIIALKDELGRCHMLGIPYLVVHPGAYTTSSEQDCIAGVAASLDAIIETTTSSCTLLLETMAGQGSTICYTFEHFAQILKLMKHKKKIGFCLDTCHVFAAGYDLSTPKNYEAMWQELDSLVGIEKIKVLHLNDSKKELGSRVDRHEDIGKGKLGLASFALLLNDKRFFDVPKILETPKESLDDDARNLKTLKELLTDETRRVLGIEKYE
jgi:deoxyribonuclease-4